MAEFFHTKDIKKGPATQASAHVAYLDAIYTPPDKINPPYKIIYKKNKHGRAELSRLEVMFGQLARLFLLSDLTPSNHLVVNKDNHVCGLAVQHLCYVIANREGLTHDFYALKKTDEGYDYAAKTANDPTQIPIYFLNKLPQGFFARLVAEEEARRLSIDYESLASIFATSYTLEEDDLHKGNYGFYLVEREGKPHAVFFKIDHDLMFVDSIMGFQTRRPFHLFHGPHAFDITADDLQSLMCLSTSSNNYWPTKFGYVSNPFDNKEYHSYAEINAFSQLSDNPKFNRAKWKSFFKHILMPKELIQKTLWECADMKKASERAEVALMTHATLARLTRLRAALFSIQEFRDYVAQLDEQQTRDLVKEIIPSCWATETLRHQVRESIVRYQDLSKQDDEFDPEDTPLHSAIRLGEYRYEETLSMFGKFINVPNKAGKTPLDIALERVQAGLADEKEVQNNSMLIAHHLFTNGAQYAGEYQDEFLSTIKSYTFKNPYLDGIKANMSYEAFKNILRDIGEDHRFGLKFKKDLALQCIEHFIEVNEGRPGFKDKLQQLKDDINGDSSEEEAAGVKYIRQLRSRLWIIRQIRGLYGWTSTQWEINTLINQAMKQNKVTEPNSFSFFSSEEKMDDSFSPKVGPGAISRM
ncbi:substrate of the Dot/Icm secretion system [Legionella steigerwaltii]|uniref:Cardiac ankyrin repeat-containing protein K n=1 Tax=Legionella steigerwaltii TaxID=460 RepID=A0A378LDW7_9GAMM|nr:Dot/Icm T4SS effector AnkK/LegA5 [Legionella steigerwaltii]KTD70226.1 cardiac ankyrin repeat -containing protein K [Legionella steigerwaltii]STY23959.1 substrate of the Dot/Icm secretion system [Legionella steigerwaltii]